MHQVGLLERANRNARPTKTPCSIITSKKENQSGDPQPLPLMDLSGAFVVLIAGFILSVVVLVCELLVIQNFNG